MTVTRLRTIILPGGYSFSLVHIPGGEFIMGDDKSEDVIEKPAHRVRLDDFYLGQFPVTQSFWKAVMNEQNPSFFKGDDRPVEQVSWNRITKEFLPALTDLTGIFFRLPTEAEWEYAARGGQQWIDHYYYSGSNKINEVGWFRDNSHGETKPVGLKYPNQLGLHDMSGNVWEWCKDSYSRDFYQRCLNQGIVENPYCHDDNYDCVIRGGSSWRPKRYCHTVSRGHFHRSYVDRNFGFRLAAPFQSIST